MWMGFIDTDDFDCSRVFTDSNRHRERLILVTGFDFFDCAWPKHSVERVTVIVFIQNLLYVLSISNERG